MKENNKVKGMMMLLAFILVFGGCRKEDRIGQDYEQVQIGQQVWMAKNWDAVRYRNGDPIPQVTDSLQWVTLKTGAWCYYPGDTARLYNWYAVNDPRGLAPIGWHVPTDMEWVDMIVDDGLVLGGFSTMPAGYVGYSTHGRGLYGMWWTSQQSDSLMASGYQVVANTNDAYPGYFCKINGFSVRLIKD